MEKRFKNIKVEGKRMKNGILYIIIMLLLCSFEKSKDDNEKSNKEIIPLGKGYYWKYRTIFNKSKIINPNLHLYTLYCIKSKLIDSNIWWETSLDPYNENHDKDTIFENLWTNKSDGLYIKFYNKDKLDFEGLFFKNPISNGDTFEYTLKESLFKGRVVNIDTNIKIHNRVFDVIKVHVDIYSKNNKGEISQTRNIYISIGIGVIKIEDIFIDNTKNNITYSEDELIEYKIGDQVIKL